MLDDISFEVGGHVQPEELSDFYGRQQFEVKEADEKLRTMIKSTFCFVTARRNGELIGFARGVTDGIWGWLAECKLDPAYQGPGCVTKKAGRIEHDSSGIAREMARLVIDALRRHGVTRIEVIAYETEGDFCTELGFKKLRGTVAMELPSGAPLPECQTVLLDRVS